MKRRASQLRSKAEATLARAPPTTAGTISTDQLLHELQVHQIELEMQNEALRETQIALEKSRDRYTDLYEFAPVGYLTLADTGLITDINITATELLNEGRKKLRGSRFSLLVLPEDRDRWDRHFQLALRNGGKQACELKLKRGHSKAFCANVDCMQAVADDASKTLRITLTDITERKDAEAMQRVAQETEHLRQLAVEATLAEERERRNLAEDLHDGPGQLLFVARLRLEALRKGPSEALDPGMQEVDDLLAEAAELVRSLTSKLSLPMLKDLGLVTALSWLTEEMERIHGLHVVLEDDGTPKPLTEIQSAILFRIIRELLVNVSKHAGVDRAQIELHARGNHLVITVADQGAGIADWHETMSARKSFGLASVNERIAFLKGAMHIQSHLGEGTVVFLEMPFDKQTEHGLVEIP